MMIDGRSHEQITNSLGSCMALQAAQQSHNEAAHSGVAPRTAATSGAISAAAQMHHAGQQLQLRRVIPPAVNGTIFVMRIQKVSACALGTVRVNCNRESSRLHCL